MRIASSVEINCPPARLWPFLENPELQKEWMKGLLENRRTSEGPLRAGAPFRMRIQEGRRIAEYDGRVTTYDPPRQLGMAIWGGSFQTGAVMRVDYRLTDRDGRTRLDYLAEVEGGQMGLLLRLLLPVIKVFSKIQVRGSMRRLRRLAEVAS